MGISVYKDGAFHQLGGQHVFKAGLPIYIKHHDYMYYDGEWHRVSDLSLPTMAFTCTGDTGSVYVSKSKGAIQVTHSGADSGYVTSFPASISVTADTTTLQLTGDLLDIDCSGVKFESITGLPASLYALNCSNCGLASIDVRNLGYIRSLYINNNTLTTLDITGDSYLIYLQASANSFTQETIDVILYQLWLNGMYGGTIDLRSQTTNAGPSQTGLQYV